MTLRGVRFTSSANQRGPNVFGENNELARRNDLFALAFRRLPPPHHRHREEHAPLVSTPMCGWEAM